jgi:SLT domain-containing protein
VLNTKLNMGVVTLNDPLREQAVAVLARAHGLFEGSDAGGGVGDESVRVSSAADRIARSSGVDGMPAAAAVRAGVSVQELRRLAAADGGLGEILGDARVDRAHAGRATKSVLDAAHGDRMPAADTPMGQREAAARMIARLRAQHGHVVRSRAQARMLASRLRRLRYVQGVDNRDAGGGPSSGGGGRAAVRTAIRRALDIKGIHDPGARARWERGMDLVASRESGYRDVENDWDSNARAGTPSKGPWQFIQSTFERYHEPGTPRNIHNFASQAAAFINYAQQHYGVHADGSNLADRIQQADPRRGPKGY